MCFPPDLGERHREDVEGVSEIARLYPLTEWEPGARKWAEGLSLDGWMTDGVLHTGERGMRGGASL